MVAAIMPDTCVACLDAIVQGEEIVLLADGWAHEECGEVVR